MTWMQLKIKSWSSNNAIVVEYKATDYTPDSESSWFANPKLSYRYSVKGKEFIADGINPSPYNYQLKKSFARDFGKVKIGEKIQVWYNPDDPSDAYFVNRGITPGPILTILFGSIIAALPYLCIKGKDDAEQEALMENPPDSLHSEH